MKNPYLRKQRGASTLEEQTNSNRSPNNKHEYEYENEINSKDVRRALQDFLQSSANECNVTAMNTSFSVSSHAMRQRKLLRKVVFELKHLTTTMKAKTKTRSSDDELFHGDRDRKSVV